MTNQISEADLCSCAYCQNYVKEIKTAYPELAVYLDQLGVDIEKTFEAMPVGLVNGKMLYSGAHTHAELSLSSCPFEPQQKSLMFLCFFS